MRCKRQRDHVVMKLKACIRLNFCVSNTCLYWHTKNLWFANNYLICSHEKFSVFHFAARKENPFQANPPVNE